MKKPALPLNCANTELETIAYYFQVQIVDIFYSIEEVCRRIYIWHLKLDNDPVATVGKRNFRIPGGQIIGSFMRQDFTESLIWTFPIEISRIFLQLIFHSTLSF